MSIENPHISEDMEGMTTATSAGLATGTLMQATGFPGAAGLAIRGSAYAIPQAASVVGGAIVAGLLAFAVWKAYKRMRRNPR